MTPAETAASYDPIALFWQRNTPVTYGVKQLERALTFAINEDAEATNGPGHGQEKRQHHALDVGCGSQGRFIELLGQRGYATTGVDVSGEMIALAKERHPGSTFYHADICAWTLPRAYDFISAWDSTFHLPLAEQEPVLRKLCRALATNGVLIFTCGGGEAGEITGSFQGQDFGYSTLGVEAFVRILADCGCLCRHVEYDQYPEQHVYIIAQRTV